MSLQQLVSETIDTLRSLHQIETEIGHAAALIQKTLRSRNKLLICGNGGSAAQAQHFSTELVGRYYKKRLSLPSIALSSDGSLVTCIGNDYGFDFVFSRQIEGLAQPNDLIIVMTTSGNSLNVYEALRKANDLKLPSIAFLGMGGGRVKGLATIDLIIPGTAGRTAQEAHLFVVHYLCDKIDSEYT